MNLSGNFRSQKRAIHTSVVMQRLGLQTHKNTGTVMITACAFVFKCVHTQERYVAVSLGSSIIALKSMCQRLWKDEWERERETVSIETITLAIIYQLKLQRCLLGIMCITTWCTATNKTAEMLSNWIEAIDVTLLGRNFCQRQSNWLSRKL